MQCLSETSFIVEFARGGVQVWKMKSKLLVKLWMSINVHSENVECFKVKVCKLDSSKIKSLLKIIYESYIMISIFANVFIYTPT